jgi:hypothetical protein
MQTYLNQRLSLFVSLEEERQLLRGAGTNELVGIFGRSGINQYTKAAGDDNATGLARVLANTAGSSYLVPDTIIIHPTNWLNTRLLRDGTGGTIGQYYGGGPLEHPSRPVHLRRSRDGAGRQLRPGRAHLAQGRRVRGGNELSQRLVPEEPEHAARRGAPRARRVPPGRVHGGAWTGVMKLRCSAPRVQTPRIDGATPPEHAGGGHFLLGRPRHRSPRRR